MLLVNAAKCNAQYGLISAVFCIKNHRFMLNLLVISLFAVLRLTNVGRHFVGGHNETPRYLETNSSHKYLLVASICIVNLAHWISIS